MPEEYAARLARHLLELADLEPVFEVDVLNHVDSQQLIAALEARGCTVQRVFGKTRLVVTHPHAPSPAGQGEATADAELESADSGGKPSDSRLLFPKRLCPA